MIQKPIHFILPKFYLLKQKEVCMENGLEVVDLDEEGSFSTHGGFYAYFLYKPLTK